MSDDLREADSRPAVFKTYQENVTALIADYSGDGNSALKNRRLNNSGLRPISCLQAHRALA
jgi:hypothetical protein